MEIFILGISFGFLVIFVLIRWLLVESLAVMEDKGLGGNKYVNRWSEVINNQQSILGIGTTLPFAILVVITLLQAWILFISAVENEVLFILILSILSFMCIMAITSVQYSYKKKS